MEIEASSYLSSAAVQPGLCWSWSKTPETVFSCRGSYRMRVFFFTEVSYEDYREMVKGRIQISWKCHGCDTQVGIVTKYFTPRCFI